MKRRFLFVSLALALLLTMVLPGTAMASRWHRTPMALFEAGGTFYTIDEGIVTPIGDSGYFRVRDRHLTGELTAGSITGPFLITYGAVVDITQAGWFAGYMDVGSYKLLVFGSSSSWELNEYGVPTIELSGTWFCLYGARGGGSFYGDLAFVPTPDGHIDYVVPQMSSVYMTGRWY